MTWSSNLRGTTGNANRQKLISHAPEPDTEGSLDDIGLTSLEPAEVQSASRVFLVELLGNMVVFIICTLVCLQLLAAAQVTLDQSRAQSSLSSVSVSMIENWKAGCDLDELRERFGGSIEGNCLVQLYTRDLSLTDNPADARYRLEFSIEPSQDGFTSGTVQIYLADELLFAWSFARFETKAGG
jgi:hypothetical protein